MRNPARVVFASLASVLACARAGVPAEPTRAPASSPSAEATPGPAAVADVAGLLRERLPGYVTACPHDSLTCEARGDLDGDGAGDRVVLVRPAEGRALGLAVLWARGGADLLGGGREGQQWLVASDEAERTEAIPTDLEFLARWDLWAAHGPPGARTGFTQTVHGRARTYAATGVRGDGILIDGGDSATVAYHDGARWRLIYLGF